MTTTKQLTDKEGMELVNRVNIAAISPQLPSLSPLHDTFRRGRAFKKGWTSK